MSENFSSLELAFAEILRRTIREELTALEHTLNQQDRLFDADKAAEILSVSVDWLYRNAKRLPFTRKLGPKMLRFSSVGLQKYIAGRKPN